MSKKFFNILIPAVLAISLFLAVSPTPALAQSTYSLNVHRDFGYGNGNQIRGNFSLSVTPTDGIQSVTYWIDDLQIGQVNAAPFTLAFQTQNYSEGSHQLKAIIQTTAGQTVSTAAATFDFVSADAENQAMKSIILPILGSVLGVILLIVLITVVTSRKKGTVILPLGSERNYGITGGAICPKCHRPFPLSLLSFNMGISSKLTRCPYCSKWSLVKRESLDTLRQAEATELEGNNSNPPDSNQNKEEKLKEMIDDSRYTDN